jgi:hypothetical protein
MQMQYMTTDYSQPLDVFIQVIVGAAKSNISNIYLTSSFFKTLNTYFQDQIPRIVGATPFPNPKYSEQLSNQAFEDFCSTFFLHNFL